MDNKYVEELFQDLGSLTPELIQEFVSKTMTQLFQMGDQLQSSDKETREKAMANALEMKALFEEKLEKLKLELSSELPALSEENQDIFEQAKEQFQSLRNVAQPKSKKRAAINLVG